MSDRRKQLFEDFYRHRFTVFTFFFHIFAFYIFGYGDRVSLLMENSLTCFLTLRGPQMFPFLFLRKLLLLMQSHPISRHRDNGVALRKLL